MQIATVRYSIATYSGEVKVYNVDPNDENEHIIGRARGQLARQAGPLPFGAESWKVVSRVETGD
jgi:hypothetical protein